MMENTTKSERLHLFSVGGSFRTLSTMGGALIAGFVPLLFIDDVGKVDAYRYATYAGLSLWFVSLIPALMLRSVEAIQQPEKEFAKLSSKGRGLSTLFSSIKHPRHIAYFVVTTAMVGFGAAAIGSLTNVAFHEGTVHADEAELGVMFAVAELGLAIATLAVPLLAARVLKVDAIALTRMLSLPFILGMGLLPLMFSEGSLLILLVGVSYFGRISIFRMSSPLDDAFNMEILEAKERATSTGFEIAARGAVSAVAIMIGSRLLGSGDYATPFMIMAVAFLISTIIYWKAFRKVEVAGIEADALPASPLTSPVHAD